jgi:hypothetical protein
MENNDVKIFALLMVAAFLTAATGFAYLAFSSSQETLRMKECASAGSDWVRTDTAPFEMQCKKK